jgi:hypothetical protein
MNETSRASFRVGRWMLTVSTAVLAIITASPLVWMLSASVKEPGEIFNSSLIPQHPTLDNFRYVFTQLPFLRYILNTFFVAGTITVIALLFHSMAGYAFARLRFPGRETIFLTIFSTFLVSLQVIIVPLFILVQKMGMVNTYAGLIIPVTFNAFGIFLLRQFYLGIPVDLQEAAIIDGASYWGILLEYHATVEPADSIGFSSLLFSGELECLYLAINYHHKPGSLAGAARDREFSGAVFGSLELYYGRLGRRCYAYAGAVFCLSTPVGRIDQDLRHQIALRNIQEFKNSRSREWSHRRIPKVPRHQLRSSASR